MPAKQRKIAVMGSRSVGKSSLAIQFVQVGSTYIQFASYVFESNVLTPNFVLLSATFFLLHYKT